MSSYILTDSKRKEVESKLSEKFGKECSNKRVESEFGIAAETVSKIRTGTAGVRLSSIRRLFERLHLPEPIYGKDYNYKEYIGTSSSKRTISNRGTNKGQTVDVTNNDSDVITSESLDSENFDVIESERATVANQESDNLNSRITPDPNFKGRDEDIKKLEELVNQGEKVILLHGKPGVGKTKLAREFVSRFDLILKCSMGEETDEIKSAPRQVEEWLQLDFNEEPGGEFITNLDRLRVLLRNTTKRIGIWIDNLETVLDAEGKFIPPHNQYVKLLRILTNPAVQSITLITSREYLRECDITFRSHTLQGLSIETCREYFHRHNITTDSLDFSKLHEQWQGNAKAMEILCGAIQLDHSSSIEQYWQETQGDFLGKPELQYLVVSQFNRLQQLGMQNAYNLLCRLGCIRYQDRQIALTREGLFSLLWDVSDAEKIRVVHSLRQRGLVNYLDGKYWLDPVIRAVAIEKLEKSEDWEKANREAAKYWTDSVETIKTIQDALTALEAYYHYIAIGDFNSACDVIIKSRNNELTGRLSKLLFNNDSLGNSFCRLGLLELILEVTNPLINNSNLPREYPLSKIYNILGDLHLSKGNIQIALEYHIKSGEIADECNHIYLKLASPTNQGFCQIAFGEYEQARDLLERVSNYDSGNFYNGKEDRFVVIARSALAFVYSRLKLQQEANDYAERVYRGLDSIRLGVQGTGYRTIFLGLAYRNLEKTEKSLEMYHRAFTFAQDNHYTQLKAQALTGLATLALEQNDFKNAKKKLLETIKLLKDIGGKWDLAEAYYYLGLTFRKMDDILQSQKAFDESLRLFQEMKALKQAEKVDQVMVNKLPHSYNIDTIDLSNLKHDEEISDMKSSNTEKQALVTTLIDQDLVRHFFKDEKELREYKQEVYESGLLDELREKAEEFGRTVHGRTYRGSDYELADIGFEEGIYLYAILRKLKPEIAVETGVCNGFSTAFILLALAKNQKGQLYSLDFPEVAGVDYEDKTFWEGKRGAVIPKDREPGWAIPEHLKIRWDLTLGKSQEKLPELLARLEKIDFFIHDSEHSYECQWFECNESYKVLREGGILMMDDMSWNNSFDNFANEKEKHIIKIGHDLGFLIK